MANNVQATAGAGTTFKTTDNAGVHTGHVNIDNVPVDPFGTNADAADANGSISAKLRYAASALSRLISSATNIAAGAAAATTSFVIGGRFKLTQDTLTDGQEGSFAMSDRGAMVVAPGVEGFHLGTGDYELVAASQTAQVLGVTGATGDRIDRVVIVPETATPGLVTLLDNAISLPLFVGGTAALVPIVVELGMKSVSGAWKLTTGADVHAIGIGRFTA